MNSKRIFITGIPTSGKSFLAKEIARRHDGIHVDLDQEREKMSHLHEYSEWVNFYSNKDEKKYFDSTTEQDRWDDLVKQSKNFLPYFLKKIAEYKNEEKFVIFECVNLLPELTFDKIDFPGIVLIGNSYEETLARLEEKSRWGSTKDLQELEAKQFYIEQGRRYKESAEKYGYKVFKNADEALGYLPLYNL